MEDLLDRLAAHVRSAPGNERLLAGRVGGFIWVMAAAGALALPLMPEAHIELYPWPVVIATAAALWGVLGIVAIDWSKVPDVLMTTGTTAGLVAQAAVTQMTGSIDSPARPFCIFILVYASCFLPMAHAIVLVVCCSAVWALPEGIEHGVTTGVAHFALTVPTFGIVGAVLMGSRLLLTSLRRSAEMLSEEHHALRALATAVASGRPPEVICGHAAVQAARLLRADGAGIIRYDPDDQLTLVGRSGGLAGGPEPGTRFPLDPASELATLRARGEPMRVDDYGDRTDEQARAITEYGFRCWAGTPVHVRGRLWGAIVVTGVEPHSLPEDAEEHLQEFAELVGMAVANTEEVARLSADATTDPLTGLANHRAFQERLRAELARTERSGAQLAVAVLDVDRFKDINDAGGHALGDEVLRTVARVLGEQLRPYDVLARLGGDELAILLPGCDDAEAVVVLERARQAIERAPFADGARVTISVGVCDVAHAPDAEALIRYADGALYWSKEHGRNRVSAYDPGRIHELSAAERLGQLQRSQALVGIRALARAIDARDPSTREHSERVAALAARMAEQRGWPAERVALLHEAALVHDVGKIGIPDAILLKPSRLTPEEYEVIQGHSELGARIVEDVLTAEQVDWIRSHHERPDGLGYPRGLRGDELSEGAALLATADAFDVMVSKRPYSPSRDLDDALREVVSLAGTQFAPEAVAALESIYGAAGAARLAA